MKKEQRPCGRHTLKVTNKIETEQINKLINLRKGMSKQTGPDVFDDHIWQEKSCKTEARSPFYVRELSDLLQRLWTHCTDPRWQHWQGVADIKRVQYRPHSLTAGVHPLAAGRRGGRARCVFRLFDLKHLEPDVNHLKMGTHPYNIGKTLLSCFLFFFSLLSPTVCLSLSRARMHTDITTH